MRENSAICEGRKKGGKRLSRSPAIIIVSSNWRGVLSKACLESVILVMTNAGESSVMGLRSLYNP